MGRLAPTALVGVLLWLVSGMAVAGEGVPVAEGAELKNITEGDNDGWYGLGWEGRVRRGDGGGRSNRSI